MPPLTKSSVILTYLIFLLILVACVPAATTPAPAETAEPATPSDELATSATEDNMAEDPTSSPESSGSAGPIPDEEATGLMYDLLRGSTDEVFAAHDRIQRAGDRRFIAPLIELLRSAQLGLVPSTVAVVHFQTLEQISGQSFGSDWPAWITWYGASDLTPPPGFTGWKGELLSAIDPGFGEFLQDEFPSRIRVEEIQWGGVLVDGIPALDNPKMIAADKADFLEPWEPVFGIAINGDARAYPLRILDWHEMANDV
ncbi:MAG: DUF3179 domain-containing (seleno)protein, partial [Anaerolineales bacterium]|nr:DUF3179 domain-containing (seleno)protein [Anaerolineales bacterium]